MIYELKATARNAFGKATQQLRKSGLIPAIVYGADVKENMPIALNANEFKKVFEHAGESSLINLSVEKEAKPRETLVKDVSYDVMSDEIIHVDFYQIKHGQKLEMEVHIKFTGIAPAVKELGGILIKNFDKITVRCLPEDLISEIVVDLSGLKTFDDRIKVKDLHISDKVEVMANPEDAVVVVSAPAEEEVEAAPKVEAAAAAAPAEGAAAAGAAPAAGTPAAAAPEKKADKKK